LNRNAALRLSATGREQSPGGGARTKKPYSVDYFLSERSGVARQDFRARRQSISTPRPERCASPMKKYMWLPRA